MKNNYINYLPECGGLGAVLSRKHFLRFLPFTLFLSIFFDKSFTMNSSS